MTEYHAIYYAHELTKRYSLNDSEKLAPALADAQVDLNLPDKLAIQKKLRDIDKKRDEAWKEYDSAAKQIEKQKDELLDTVEERLKQAIEEKILFTIRWKIV